MGLRKSNILDDQKTTRNPVQPSKQVFFFKVAYRMSWGPHGQQAHGRFYFGVYEYSLSLSLSPYLCISLSCLWCYQENKKLRGGLAGG